jgi:hypothetical protein
VTARRFVRLWAFAACVLVGVPGRAAAQEAGAASSAPDPSAPSGVGQAARVLAGAFMGLVVHEAGHVGAGLAAGAHPRLRGIDAGWLPFFVIKHDDVSRRKEFVISSAGFWAQQWLAELVLTRCPDLRHEAQPFAKGAFAFHLGTSALYAGAAFLRRGPAERDTRGMAISLGRGGVPEPAVGVLVLAPAALDAYRYLRPDATWARWASRGLKVAAIVLVAAAK